MGRINLRVPYEEKEEVKKLGAKWDWNMRVWALLNKSASGRVTL